jgi:hypothetical protein
MYRFVLIVLFVGVGLVQAQEHFNIEQVARLYNYPDQVRDIYIVGDRAYLAASASGLQIFDISDPDNPESMGYYDDNIGQAYAVQVVGNIAYVCDYPDGIIVLNVEDPENIRLINFFETPGSAQDIFIRGQIAYVADFDSLSIYNIEDPTSPQLLSTSEESVIAVKVSGDFAYCACFHDGFKVIDVSNPRQPRTVSSVRGGGFDGDVIIQGNIAYIISGRSGIIVYDISDPTNPEEISVCEPRYGVRSIDVSGTLCYAAHQNEGMTIIDYSDPTDPDIVSHCDLDGQNLKVACSDNHVYVANWPLTLCVVDAENPARPVYTAHNETFGWINDYYIDENSLYLTTIYDGIKVIDISNPSNPQQTHQIDLESVWDIVIVGDHLFAACRNDGIVVLDISDLDNIRAVGNLNEDWRTMTLTQRDNLLFSCGDDGVTIIDIEDPENPYVLVQIDNNRTVYDSEVIGDYLYFSENGCFAVLDISNPEFPVEVFRDDEEGRTRYFGLDGDRLFVQAERQGIYVFDVSDPSRPSRTHHIETSYLTQGMYAQDDFLYVTGSLSGGLHVYNISNLDNPEITGFYDTPGKAKEVFVLGELAYVLDRTNLGVYDCTFAITPNQAPVWDCPSDTFDVVRGERLVFQLTATDNDQRPNDLQIDPNNLPRSAEFKIMEEGLCEFSWQTTLNDLGAYYPHFVASDGELSETIIITIRVVEEHGVSEEDVISPGFGIDRIHPNPFNSTTTITYSLPMTSNITLKIYDISGRLVLQLFNGRQQAGIHSTTIEADGWATGLYFLRLEASGQLFIQKVMLIR